MTDPAPLILTSSNEQRHQWQSQAVQNVQQFGPTVAYGRIIHNGYEQQQREHHRSLQHSQYPSKPATIAPIITLDRIDVFEKISKQMMVPWWVPMMDIHEDAYPRFRNVQLRSPNWFAYHHLRFASKLIVVGIVS